ncbi:MAG: hypothetical protein L3V56_02545 [Candidatus Magnetoovum sp. WYHC-5]|nr:hypothetical protein [Candidatus Magnetoovum sp. WYHC-5]
MKKIVIIIAMMLVFLFLNSANCFSCSVGEKVEVEWKGSWYPASVLDTSGSRCFIHYDGYDNSWDEWVGPGRVRYYNAADFSQGESVLVKWKGHWYNAHVVKAKKNKFFIHYEGYDNSWDEWVGPDRIKAK